MGFRIGEGVCVAHKTLSRHHGRRFASCWIVCYLLEVCASFQSHTNLRQSTLRGCAVHGCTRDRKWTGVLNSRSAWCAGRAFDKGQVGSHLVVRNLPQRGTCRSWLSQEGSLMSRFHRECWSWEEVCRLSPHLWAFCGREGIWFCCFSKSSLGTKYRRCDHSQRWFVGF